MKKRTVVVVVALLILAAALVACCLPRPFTPVATVLASRLDPLDPHWILEHVYVKKNVLDEDNFKGTRGCVCIFRDRDIETVFADPHLAPLFPYFQELRAVGSRHARAANAFVMNVLVMYPGRRGVGWHVDDTMQSALPSPTRATASAVSVMYTTTTPKSCGGAFHVKRDDDAVSVQPRTGMIVVFPGTYDHKVSALASHATSPRVSLVVESYELSAAEYDAMELTVPR
jgi:hypothetical protein